MTGALRANFAVRVSRAGDRWRVQLLADDAGDELPVLERALGEPGAEGWPPPFVVVVDSRLYFVVLRHGPGGMVRDDDERQIGRAHVELQSPVHLVCRLLLEKKKKKKEQYKRDKERAP